jgi:hypothetical protein
MEPTQGTPAQAKPVRKRRRWLIVAFVLVLVSLGTWWYWPRGDARFVGKWIVNGSSDPMLSVEFWINGHAQQSLEGRPVFAPASYWVEDGKVYWQSRNRLSLRGFKDVVGGIRDQWQTGGRIPFQGIVYEIATISTDRITLQVQTPTGPSDDLLTRLPE